MSANRSLHFLIVTCILFWLGLLINYFSFYSPFLDFTKSAITKSANTDGNSMAIILKNMGAEINYIWYRFAQIGLFSFVSTGILFYIKHKVND